MLIEESKRVFERKKEDQPREIESNWTATASSANLGYNDFELSGLNEMATGHCYNTANEGIFPKTARHGEEVFKTGPLLHKNLTIGE